MRVTETGRPTFADLDPTGRPVCYPGLTDAGRFVFPDTGPAPPTPPGGRAARFVLRHDSVLRIIYVEDDRFPLRTGRR